MGESKNKTTGIVFSIASSFGLLLSKIAYILEINEDASEEVKAEKVEAFLHKLGYDIKDGKVGEVSTIISGVIDAAKGIEGVVNGLVDFPWGKGASDILDFKISDETKKAGANIFAISKGIVNGIIALKDSIKAFDDNPSSSEALKFLNDNNLGRRFGDHFVISMFQSIDNGHMFDVVFDVENLSDTEINEIKKTAFVKSIKIILATFELFEIFDTQEVNVLYQELNEKTKDLKALNDKRQDEGKDKVEEVTTTINVVQWGRFADVFSFHWGYLADIYPMEASTAKLLFKRFSKLIDAIGKDELLDLLHVDDILDWLKSLIESDDKIPETNKKTTLDTIKNQKKESDKLKGITPIENTNSLTIDKFQFSAISTSIKINKEDLQKYIVEPTERALKREGVTDDIDTLKGPIKQKIITAGKKILELSNKRLTSIQEKDLKDWFKFVKSAYENEKIKIDTSDFDILETLESVKDVILDDIVKIDEFKRLILEHLQSLLSEKLKNRYDDPERITQISLAVALEISSTFIRRFILPKLEDSLASLGNFIQESLMLVLDLTNLIKDLSSSYTALKNLINTVKDTAKSWKDKFDAVVAFIKELTKALPPLPAGKLYKFEEELKVLQTIYDKVDPSSLNQQMIAICVYNYSEAVVKKTKSIRAYDHKDNNKSMAIELCAQLIEKQDHSAAINIFPRVNGTLNHAFDLGDKHKLSVELEGAMNNEENNTNPLGFQISKKGISLTGGEDDVSAGAVFKFERLEPWLILNHKYIKIAIENYPQTLSFVYDKEFEAKYIAALEGASVTLTKQFFKDKVWKIISDAINDDIVASFDTTLSYSTVSGFSFAGAAKLEADFDFSKSFKNLKIDGLHLSLGSGSDKNSLKNLSFKTAVSTNLGLDISGVAFTISDIGIKLDTPILKGGKLSDWDFSVGLNYPDGVGLAIDTEVVRGGGFIKYDKEESEFLGVFELNVVDKFELGVLTILNLDVEDVPGNFSFVGLMMFSGFSVPLGFNFYLTGAGGALGLNRMIDGKVVESGVHDGTLETVFLAKDLQKNINKIEKVTNQYFPIKKEQFFFGLIAKIDFNIPATMTAEVGLFLQFPSPVEIIIFGGLHVVMPKEKPVIKINVFFAGGINFEERFWFDASIRDSSIGGIDVFGDIAMRVLWGKTKGMLVSAGGFHPSFEVPAKYNMPANMQRLSMKIDKKIFTLTMGAYFAVGTNTVQFGAKLDLKASVKVAKLKGYLSFDALFIFNPFRFEVAIKAGVALSAFGVNLLAVELAFNFSGTSPWRVKGKASVKILFWKVRANFDKSWGDKAKEIAPDVTQLFPIFIEAWNDPRNWKTLALDYNDKLVILLDTPKDSLVLHPLQGFSFEQDRIPLNQPLDSYGKTLPADYTRFNFNPKDVFVGEDNDNNAIVENGEKVIEQALFIPADFIKMSNEDKLASPSFVDMDSGFTYKSTQIKNDKENPKYIDYLIDADIVTINNGDFSVKADKDAEEKVIKKKDVEALQYDTKTPFGEDYEYYEKEYDNPMYAEQLYFMQQEYENKQNSLTNEGAIKRNLKSNYKLYNKVEQRFEDIKDKVTHAENKGSYAEVLSVKNRILKERDSELRSTDLVIMVE